MSRKIEDELTKDATATLPNAAATTTSGWIDLGTTSPHPTTEQVGVKISTTQATGANSKIITIKVEDTTVTDGTPDGGSAADVAGLTQALQITESGGNYAASEATVYLPAGVRQAIRVSATGESTGGDATDGTLTVSLVY